MTRLEAIGHVSLFAALAVLWIVLLPGCAHVPNAKETCTGAETRREAARLVVPKLAASLICAAEHETDDEILACVTREFEVLKAQVQPLTYACGWALIQDAVSAAKK
jgi:hypothetical protein